jgi:energy-coupling factor transport system ATP-binding protein
LAMIEVNGATFTYPGNKTPALRDVSFEVQVGTWLAIVGHNGSGKSTLARLIDGLLPLGTGTITVDGLPVTVANLTAIHQRVAFVFQNPDNQFVGTTVADDVAFGLENQRLDRNEMQARVNQALKEVNMLEFADREPAQLSGGQKQRVALAGALALHPQVLIVDEATAMLDPEGKDQIMKLLTRLHNEGKLTILSITHDTREAALADQMIMIDGGQLVANGDPKKLLADKKLMEDHQLTPTFLVALKDELASQGVTGLDDVTTEDEMVTWIWQKLNSTK